MVYTCCINNCLSVLQIVLMAGYFLDTLQKIRHGCSPNQDGCLLWTKGPYNTAQYPYGIMTLPWPCRASLKRKTFNVHRLMFLCHYQLTSLPDGFEVSHLCRNSRCVNPEHLIMEHHVINEDRKLCHAATSPTHHCRHLIKCII